MTVFMLLRHHTSPTTIAVSLTLVWRLHLCLASTHGLVVPPSQLSTVGDRTFRVAAARVWNSLADFVSVSTSLPRFYFYLFIVVKARMKQIKQMTLQLDRKVHDSNTCRTLQYKKIH